MTLCECSVTPISLDIGDMFYAERFKICVQMFKKKTNSTLKMNYVYEIKSCAYLFLCLWPKISKVVI